MINGFTRLYDLGLTIDQFELCYRALAYYKYWCSTLSDDQKAMITDIMSIIEAYLRD